MLFPEILGPSIYLICYIPFNIFSSIYNYFYLCTYSDGALKKLYKELITIRISVVINCESCMEWHIKEALNSGAERDQIIESIEVAIEMGGGPATVSSRFPLKVLDYYKNESI
ncbi:MAG: carboxymuconolactone decarboxylase family protein [Promethearchaeota archaeon]